MGPCGPAGPKLSQFIDTGATSGTEDATTTSVRLLHDKDTITLKNPYEGVVAHFQVKTITVTSYKYLWQTVYEPQKVDVKNFTLTTGQSKSFTTDEGTETYFGTGRAVNQDITVTLMSVDCPEGSKQTGPGRPIFGEGGYWNPQSVINRVRDRRMFLGSMSNGKGRRKGLIDMIQEGDVHSPQQAAMIYAADVIEDSAERFNLGLRPY